MKAARPLSASGRSKPVDIGSGRLAASFGYGNAALLSLLAYDPDWGVVELTDLPPFDEAQRGDPVETRRYRSLIAQDDWTVAWLETADGQPFEADRVDLADPQRPVWRGRLGDVPVVATATAQADGSIAMSWQLGAASRDLTLRLCLRGRLVRPPLAEITETDPPRPTHARPLVRAKGQRLTVGASGARTAFALDAAVDPGAAAGDWLVEGGAARLAIALPTGANGRISLRCAVEGAQVRTDSTDSGPRQSAGATHRGAAVIVDRALAYVRGCTCLATSADERVLLTDHRLLPLSWTRDAYYQALLLLVADGPGDRGRVAGHLRWLWRRCDRPDGRWVRSHHANGHRKDLAFQADQQLYPMIELADFWRLERGLPGGVEWTPAVSRALAAVWAALDDATGLMASAENAADDPAPAPFIGASQIILWYTLQRLAELADHGALGLAAVDLRSAAVRVRAGFETHVAAAGRWAYASDGPGTEVAYHDANDLPVALAPLWGFCPPDDPGWRETMAFAFSSANPGFYPGPRGGLGSRHTPGPWTLGDVQAWIRARVASDDAGTALALDRLESVAFEDGMLPEAYSASVAPDNRIRHWFAWPGAALAALLLLDARADLDRLRATP